MTKRAEALIQAATEHGASNPGLIAAMTAYVRAADFGSQGDCEACRVWADTGNEILESLTAKVKQGRTTKPRRDAL